MVTNKLENKTLTFFIEGNVDSANAQQIEEAIFPVLDSTEHEKVIIDVNKLSYISSAGLRVFLKICKKEPSFAVINASNEVYSIFEMTGFTSIMKIEKGLQKVSLKNAKLIGSGYWSEVYRLDADTIVKVFTRTNNIDDVKRELDLAKQAFVLGVPTAISYGVVDVEGRLGLVFEMLDCQSLRDIIRDDVFNREKWIEKYSELLLTINSTDVGNTQLPNINEKLIEDLEVIKPRIELEYYDKFKKLLSEIPPQHTFVHGDCHIKNILVNNGEFFVIDMDTLSYGNPIFELSAFYSTYVIFEETEPGNCKQFLDIDGEIAKKLFYKTINYYFKDKTPEVREQNTRKVEIMGYIFMLIWTTKAEGEKGEFRFKFAYNKIKELLPAVENLILQ